MIIIRKKAGVSLAQTLVVCMSNPLHRLVCEPALSGLIACKLPEREFFLDSLGNLGISLLSAGPSPASRDPVMALGTSLSVTGQSPTLT